jgi:hypothetical protein
LTNPESTTYLISSMVREVSEMVVEIMHFRFEEGNKAFT